MAATRNADTRATGTGIPNALLQRIYDTRIVHGADGCEHGLAAEIPYEYAEALYRLVLRQRPQVVVEVGMAFGLSTLAILTALDEVGGPGRLLSIDPGQSMNFHGVGVANVERSGLAARHELVEQPDFVALPALLSRGTSIDLAYVDGWHTFDHVLLDFFYLDKMLGPGGLIGFNDCNWPAVEKALGFVTTHRKYEELPVEFRVDRRKGRMLRSLYRKSMGTPDRWFRKLEDWQPAFDYYQSF
jgi:predicted O-methyltransferase YrrM